jgi:NitT/TauT family transport system permease protein
MQKLVELANDGSLGYNVAITVIETLAGFGIGTVVGIAIAGLFWWWDFLSDVADPYVVVRTSADVITAVRQLVLFR